MNLFSTFIRLGFISAFLTPLYVNATTYVPISVGDITIIIPVDNVPIAKNDLLANIPERHVNLNVPVSVIVNDIDENQATLTVTLESQTSTNGQPIDVSADDQTVIYTTLPGWNGTDTFQYRITDEAGQQSDIATATLTFVDANDPPTAVEDRISITPNANCNANTPHSELIYYVDNCSYPLGNLLANDIDDGGNASLRFGDFIRSSGGVQTSIAIVSGSDQEFYIPDHGLLTITPTGTIEYVALPSFFGADPDPTKNENARLPRAGIDFFRYTVRDELGNGLESKDSFVVISIDHDDNERPIIIPTSPAQGAQLNANASVMVSANATDDDGIFSVEFSLDGGETWVLATGSYQFDFGQLPAGDYTLLFRASDNLGRNSITESVSFSVAVVPNSPPAVSTYEVSPSAPYTINTIIGANATATDSDGVIYGVEFSLDGGDWVSDDSPPYSVDFGALSQGTHTIAYRAKDNEGEYSAIVYRHIEVNEAPNVPPVTTMTSPVPNQVYLTTQSVFALAQGIDSDGDILSVHFRVDGEGWKPPVTEPPYEFDLGTLNKGPHTIEVRSRDDDGEYSDTVSVEIMVNAPPRRVVFIHTDALGSPAAETDENGEKQ